MDNLIHVDFNKKNKKVISYSSLEIAEFLIKESNYSLTSLKLQKLLFFSQDWCLALTGYPLMSTDFEFSAYGPILPEIDCHFSSFNGETISKVSQENSTIDHLNTIYFLKKILKEYSNLSTITLSQMALDATLSFKKRNKSIYQIL